MEIRNLKDGRIRGAGMNRIILLGRLTKDPEVRYTNTGKVVAQFTLAVDRPFTGPDGKREADFIPVIIWGKSAETIGNHVQKGHRVLAEGRLQIRSYDGKDGKKVYTTDVVANRVEFLTKPNSGGHQEEQRIESVTDAFIGVDEDLPF